ncbi:methyltransferase [Streptomyces uncialis]|uniref:methyltransferase n=1 Tax=Streptomyces uncialis TaxID=1048205 RepID=UPI00386D9F84|nr:acetylserotonin O-methyltransferase [Streptomyces uncialis]
MTPSVPSSAVAPALADQLVQQSWGFVTDRALQTAAELGIPDLVARGPVSLAALAEATGSLPDALGRLLRPLVATGVFTLDGTGGYGPTGTSVLLESAHPQTLRPWFRLMYRVTFRMFDDPLFTLRTGRPAFEERFGNTYFGHMAEHPDDNDVFHAAMASFTRRTARAVASAYDFSDAGSLADIGGGLGTLISEILSSAPAATGTVFDLPHMAEAARGALDAAGVGERATVVSGDFFAAVPRADTLLLSWILHDWDDERSLEILRACRKAQESGQGRLLIVEAVLPELPGPGQTTALDLVMLFGLGGRERTETEYAALLDTAGYEHIRTLPLEAPGMHVIEARTRG